MLFPVVLPFLRCNCHLVPRSYIPLLHYWLTCCPLLSVGPIGAPLATLSLVEFFCCLCSTVGLVWPCPLFHAGMAWWAIPLPAANFSWDPSSPWVHFFGWLWCLKARYQSLCRFFSVLTVSTGPLL
jgi:hypothetical protein